ncbi:MAG: MBL fold metallo-hydrolase [Treponema sp.]|nr:MBL fold metallo-hydrolase [Treponema sp.]
MKSRISAILERASPGDLAGPESRERFLAALPPWLFGIAGGNTSCVSISFEDSGEIMVFDAGSGIRELGLFMERQPQKQRKYRVFFSHFHWDHIQGLPFFNPAYDSEVSIDFYSPLEKCEAILSSQMRSPYFPVTMDSMAAKKTFHHLKGTIAFGGGVSVSYKKMNHPGASFSYLIQDGEHRIIYATDTELSAEDFIKNDENIGYFRNADVIILDAQYTLGEAIEKYNWGHTAFSMGVDFAINWGIKHLVLFHHDPAYDDKKLFEILQAGRMYTERMNHREIEITLAMEGSDIVV